MVNRRNLIALSIGNALSGKQMLALDEPDPRRGKINTGGLRMPTISPDASMLVGISDDDRFTFFDLETGDYPAESEPFEYAGFIDPESIVWSPDSSKVAFSLAFFLFSGGSSIFVVDAQTGKIKNATSTEVIENIYVVDDNLEAAADVCPMWDGDETILFSRVGREDPETISAWLMSLNVADGKVSEHLNLRELDVQFITGTPKRLEDGRLVFDATHEPDPLDNYGITVFDGDTAENISLSSQIAGPTLKDVDTGFGMVWDRHTQETYLVSLDSEATTLSLAEAYPLQDLYTNISIPAFAPAGDGVVMIASDEHDQIFVLHNTGDGVHRIGQLLADPVLFRCRIVSDQVFITSEDDCWLVPLDGPESGD